MLKGIDISKYQAGIDLSKIDTDFVICKATEGVGYTDAKCDGFYQQAKKLGKKLGVYHYARPDLRNTAKAEAEWFVRETKGYHKEAILVLDWEAGDLGNITWAKTWLDRVKELTGVKPLIYMSASVMNSYDWSSVVESDYGLWVANYGSNDGTAQESAFDRHPMKYWNFYALWQYTSVGRLNGYSGNLDLDYFNGSKEAWDKYAGGSVSSSSDDSTSTDTQKKSIEEIAQDVINGKYGNQPERQKKLEAEGYDYQTVQNKVNEILGINNGTYYTVKSGDNLSKIAEKYNTTWQKIYEDNKSVIGSNPDLIKAGQRLIIK